MKRILCLLLVLTMVLSLFAGCNSEKTVESEAEAATEVNVETTAPIVQEESHEIQMLLEQGWIPETIKQDLDETILWNEMLTMIEDVICLCDESPLAQWHSIVNPIDSPMERDDGMLAIYEAACVLGIGDKARYNQPAAQAWLSANLKYSRGYSPNCDLFSNEQEMPPYVPYPGQEAASDYIEGAKFFSVGQSSGANLEPFFAYADEEIRYDDPLTRREAITATAKLIQAYEDEQSGGYTIPETNWDDPLLAEAKAARETILNSPTTITKGEELILGETYTGTAYYVSNTGNDRSDGKTPETAWATLNKVERAKLKYGDAVFFERGGTWYGSLKMQHGVTYSAYGEGAKPIITGSPQDAAQPEKWTLYAETADGGKIWQYAEPMMDAGVILLNGGEVVARKAYPLWNGNEYINACEKTYVMEEELADLMFFSALELRGSYATLGTRLEESRVTGPLYLRCDAGNPGEVYDKIEISVVCAGTTTADKGWNAIDNLHFRGFSVSGMDCNNHSNIVYQNCEADWCCGAVKNYDQHDDKFSVMISGGGLLLFGHDVTGRNNYIHDCENKGIAVVINGSDGNPAWLNRTNILAEGNVVERCGSSAYMLIGLVSRNADWKFEDVRFINNYMVNGSYGWRQQNKRDLQDNSQQMVMINNVLATGEVLFENNLFYRASGTLIHFYGENLQKKPVLLTFRDNTYVQDAGQILFAKLDGWGGYYPETTMATFDQTLMEKCIKEYMGDTTGKVIILE